MSIAFTKKEKEYFNFLFDMGFVYDTTISDKQNLCYKREYYKDLQRVSIGKDGFVGHYMGKYINDIKYDLFIKTSYIGSPLECNIPQQIDRCNGDDETAKIEIFEKYKKLILNSLDYFDKHDHLTADMNEHVYNNYSSIVESIDFKPKTMEELNEYAIRLRDEGKISFKDYIYIISSLLIIYFINNTEFKYLYYYDEKAERNTYGIEISNKEQNTKEAFKFSPTIVAKLMCSKKIDDLFIAYKAYLDNYSKKEGD